MHERERGVWTLRVELPTKSGQRRWKSMTVRGNKTAARSRLRTFVNEVETKYGTKPLVGEWTVRHLFDEWIQGPSLTTENPRAATTIYQERMRFERHVAPPFGDQLVETLDRDAIRKFYSRLRTSHKVNGEDRRALSGTSVARIHEQMRAMCAWGVDHQLISHNPLRDVKRPRIIHAAPQPPEPEILDRLLQHLWGADRKLWIAVRLGATTALRRGELCGLRWGDITFKKDESAQVLVERGLTYVPGRGLIETDTKTGVAGSARIGIDKELASILRVGWTEFYHLNDNGSGYIFSDDPQGVVPWHPDTFTSRLRLQVNRWGKVPKSRRVTFKSLRSYTASELEALGNDAATAQAVLRHKSPMTTQRHYAAARERKMRGATIGVGEQFTKRGNTRLED
jgi:integrase